MKNKGLLGVVILLSVMMLSGGTFTSHSTYSLSDAFVVSAADGYVYIMGESSGLISALSLADLDSPAYVSQLDIDRNIRGSFIEGDYIYLNGFDGLQIIDISDPANMSTAYTDWGSGGEDIYVQDGYAYLACSNCLTIYDVSVADSPSLASSSYLSNTLYGIEVRDSFIFAGCNNAFNVYKVSADHSSVSLIGSASSAIALCGLAVSGDYAYVTGMGYGLFIYDISDPSTPTLISAVSADGWAYEAYYRNNFVYLAAESYLSAIDVTDRYNPVQSGSYAMPSCYAYDVSGYGADVFVAAYSSGLRTLTYSDDAYLPNDMAKAVTKESDAKRISVEYASGKIVIDYTVKNNSDISVSLYDCSGRDLGVIYSGSVSGSGKVEAEAGGINKGTYFVKTKLGSDTYTEKVTLI